MVSTVLCSGSPLAWVATLSGVTLHRKWGRIGKLRSTIAIASPSTTAPPQAGTAMTSTFTSVAPATVR